MSVPAERRGRGGRVAVADTPIEVPHPYRRLSEIDLTTSSIPPDSVREADPRLEALARVDEVGRAHAASFLAYREERAEKDRESEERFRQAEHERRLARMKQTGVLVCSIIAALGGAVSVVLEALK